MSKVTAVIQIGNSDDKLTQRKWSYFISAVKSTLDLNNWRDIHFSGGSSVAATWQNYCIVVLIEEKEIDSLKNVLGFLSEEFNQDSIAVTIGETEFV